MNIEQLQHAFVLTNAKCDEINSQIENISNRLVKERGPIQDSLLEQLDTLENQHTHLKSHALSLQQQLSKRGLTTSQIQNIPKNFNSNPSSIDFPSTPTINDLSFPTAPSQNPSNSSFNEQKILSTIDNERFHQKHIQEVEEWNKQETIRQQQIREQNLKLLQLHEQLQKMKISEEEKIAQQKIEVAKEQEALRLKEKQLNEQQKQQIHEIDMKLAELRQERSRLANNQLELPVNQQQQLENLQNIRKQILGIHSSNNSNTSDNSNNNNLSQDNNSMFPSTPQNSSINPQNYNSVNHSNQNYSTNDYDSSPNYQDQQRNIHINPSLNNPSQESLNSSFSHSPNNSNNPNAYNNNLNYNPNNPNAENNNNPNIQQMLSKDNNNTNNTNSDNFNTNNRNLNNSNDLDPEIALWKQEQNTLENWQSQSSNLQKEHQERLQKQEQAYLSNLQQREENLRKQWAQELTEQQRNYETERTQLHNQLTDDMLCRMSEAELRLWMEHSQKNQFIDEMLERRQKLLDEQAWILQQDLENKQMALSFREDDLRKKEWEIQQEREAELRALNRIFLIIVETTNPEGKRTGQKYQMEVRAGDSLFKLCERIPHDKDLFCVKMEYNGYILEDLDKNLLELKIPDNAFMISRLMPKADVDVLNLIPCEDCGKRFHAEVFASHKCMKQFSQTLPSQRKTQQRNPQQTRTSNVRKPITTVARPQQRHIVKQQTKEVIPCEYCEGLFPIHKYDSHVNNCSERKPRVPRVTRYRYY